MLLRLPVPVAVHYLQTIVMIIIALDPCDSVQTGNALTLPVEIPNINRIERGLNMPYYSKIVMPPGIILIIHFVKVSWFIIDFEYIFVCSITSFEWWTRFRLISQHFICLFGTFILPHYFRCFQWKANVRQYARYSYGKLNTRNEKSLHWLNQSYSPQTSKDHMITAYSGCWSCPRSLKFCCECKTFVLS